MKRRTKFKKKQNEEKKESSSENQTKISSSMIKDLFQKSADVAFHEYTFNHYNVLISTCDAMIDDYLLNDALDKLDDFFSNRHLGGQLESAILNGLLLPTLKKATSKEEIITGVYTGSMVIHFEEHQLTFLADIAQKPNRNPEETKTEVPIKGPRDNFIEDIAVNIALIRKRLPTNSFCVEKFKVGRRTKTNVAILYFDDIANKEVIDGVRKRIKNTDIDIIFSGEIFMEFIDKSSKLFPRHHYTGRPDIAIQSLARGRIFILIDGVSYGAILPINMFFLFKTGEDNEYPVIYGSFERLLRVFGIGIGALLPAFWLALTTFHQDQLPLQLLATVVQSRTGLPFPTALEMFIMIFAFELFREAGLRLPEAIGGTVSVVGGLIIGDAAIRAGITSPAMVVVIAISTIATFTLLNQSLVAAISVIRFIAIIVTALFGMFGFLMTVFFTLVYLANIHIYGLSYLNVGEDISWGTIIHTFFRVPQKDYPTRPKMLKPIDKTRFTKEDKQ